MTQRTILAARSLLLCLAAASALNAQEMSPAPAASLRQGVRATLDAYREHAAAGRWDALIALYDDNPHFRWVESGVVVSRSVGRIHEHLGELPAGTRIETTFQDAEIMPLAPGVAEVVTPFQTRVVDAKGGGYSFGGVMTLVLVQRGGGWKILSGHASSSTRRSPSPRADD